MCGRFYLRKFLEIWVILQLSLVFDYFLGVFHSVRSVSDTIDVRIEWGLSA
jgi:hypothetical protein